LLRISCYSSMFPDTVDSLEQRRWLSSQLEIVGALTECCKGILILPHGSSQIRYSSGARGLEDPHLVCSCVAPTEGSTLDSRLAHEPTSGCIATTRSSLPGSKWTSVKSLVSSLCWGFLLWLIIVIDSSSALLLYIVGIRIKSLAL
jgi:hypothetical protein